MVREVRVARVAVVVGVGGAVGNRVGVVLAWKLGIALAGKRGAGGKDQRGIYTAFNGEEDGMYSGGCL